MIFRKGIWRDIWNYNLVVGLLMGISLTTTIAFGTVAFASSGVRGLSAEYSDISIIVDSEQIVPKDANGVEVEPFIVDGTTYVPLRAVADAFDKEVAWNELNSRVEIFSKSDEISDNEILNEFMATYGDCKVEGMRIKTIEKFDGQPNTWAINFDVKPMEEYRDEFVAGEGEDGGDGWIVNKSVFVYATKMDGVFSFKLI
ncbi:MAG: copper amine oxidase N-terminal domain-containing protein [Clostridiales bacterium]|jgi:hypothetical protein|nr:copper amine oxidase N-terminal domain-containing protein [Clostridiales bacterium]